jgi:hypothetical protein
MTFIDLQGDLVPKRGDLVQSCVRQRKERTWLILRARRMRTMPKGVPRYQVWMARWWELEADFRMRLFRSAERNGGQNVFWFERYKAKKKNTFEEHMRR